MKLSEIRKAAGLTQSLLAQKSNISITSIKKYECGVRDINNASGMTLYKLSKALGCKIEDLLELEKYNQGVEESK